jgi:hypothetical protein
MVDLTILYITASEIPIHWAQFQIKNLLNAVNTTPIISVSKKPLALGTNLIDTEPKSIWNIYMQILRAAIVATTPFVAIAEDDVLYTKAHFSEFRPKENIIAYDRSRWSLFTWDSIYCLRQRISNCSMIAPRQYLIDALQERKQKWPNGAPAELLGEVGRPIVDRRLGVSIRNTVEFYSYSPIVQLNHIHGSDPTQQKQRKRHGQIQAFDIPIWGKATDIIKEYR